MSAPIGQVPEGIAGAPSVYPDGATPFAVRVFGANVPLTATMPAVPGVTAYLLGFALTGAGATAGQLVTVGVTGIMGGQLGYDWASVTGATALCPPLQQEWAPALPASGPNTAIVIAASALGAGNTTGHVNMWGFYL